MPFVTVEKENSGNVDLHYEDHGSGKPVVLIHGYPLSGASWERQLPPLLDAGYRVITYSRRGFGQSSKPTTGYNYDTFSEELHQLLNKLDLKNVASVACVRTWYEDFRKDLARITSPTLVIHGDADRIVPYASSGQRTAKLVAGARLVTIKNGPHCITWTHADEVNTALLNFLREEKKLLLETPA